MVCKLYMVTILCECHLNTLLLQIWNMLKDSAGGKDSITLEEFININDILGSQRVRDQIASDQMLFFDVIDTNHDGFIQWGEFEVYFKAHGLNPENAKASFEMIDTNKDGVLSKEEFIAAAVDYFTSREDTPSKVFFGPLLD